MRSRNKICNRILALGLSAAMLLSPMQLPGSISYAEELPQFVQEEIAEQDKTAGEDAPQKESGQEETGHPETGTPAGGEAEQPGTETPAGEENEDSAENEDAGENDSAQPPAEEERPSDQEPEDPADQEEEEDGESVSDNTIQISDNSLLSVEDQEIWAEAEIEGAYQFGGAPSADGADTLHAQSVYTESAYTDEQIMDYLYQQMKARVASIEISQYGIPSDDTGRARLKRLVNGALNEHPDLYFVGMRYSYSSSGESIVSVSFTYNTAYDDTLFDSEVNRVLALTNGCVSDLEKAIVLHDYLAVNCEYDYDNLRANTLPADSYSAYGVLVNRIAVCQGYALAYKYLLNLSGIECHMVTSDAMEHAWNLIKLDGEYYQVDVTWDDPVRDIVGRVSHTFMFCSDETFQDTVHDHHDWVVTRGADVVDYRATDTRYDVSFWTDCTSPLVLNGSDCYYISSDGGLGGKPALMKTEWNAITADGTALQTIDRWTGWQSSGYWSGAYSGLYRIGDRLYYNDKANIYTVAMDGSDKRTAFRADTTNGYIYGSAYCQDRVLYALHQEPNLETRETVLTADIDLGGVEPEPITTYKITYVLQGGTNHKDNPTGYTEADGVITLKDPVREGYQFEGWYSDTAYSVRVTEIRGENKSDITLYAKWKPLAGAEGPIIDLTPAEGNVLIGISGTYYTETAEKILNRLNAIRKEACREGVRNPVSGEPLTMDDYVPLQWSSDLEAIARLRAAEATVKQAHERPNGQSCFTVVTQNGEQSWAENLAWNYDGLMKGIEQWYEEKNDWVKQTGGVTGHYTSIISPRHTFVGVGVFRQPGGGWYAVAQEFSYKDNMDSQKDSGHGSCTQYMEMQGKNVTKLAFSKTPTAFLQEGDSCSLPVKVTVGYKGIYGDALSFSGPYREGGYWTSSDEKVAVVDAKGEVSATGKGEAQITMSAGTKSLTTKITVYGSGESPITVKAPDTTTYKVGQKIDLKGGTVTYPSGSTAKTTALAANMISGFDSSKPGICKVKVSAGGYAASFETLIVEEPKLTAPAGRRLAQIELPQNAYGSYSWQDNTQTVEKAGVYTFTADFTPNDEAKFQKRTDISVEVTAQETLGNDTIVTFKTNRVTYNGARQEPKPVVRMSDVVLKEGQDYELSYKNNKDAGTATVTVDGIGCYLGSVVKTFEIQPARLLIRAKDKTITVGARIPTNAEYEYETDGLLEDDDLTVKPRFSCDIVDTTITGSYEIVPSGADAGTNYTIAYENGRLQVAYEAVSCTVTFDVQGHGTAPARQTGLRVGSLAERPADPAADGYRFDGWYRDAACGKIWDFDTDIVQTDTTLYAKWMRMGDGGGFALQEIGDVYFTGKACKPAVSVYDGDTLLKAGRDYQIKYYNNTNANKDGVLKTGNGEGANFKKELPYVEIVGKGNYTDRTNGGNQDTVKVNFNILRAPIGDGSAIPAKGVTLKCTEQLAAAKKVQKPFSSMKYVKAMKRDTDFTVRLTVENARDETGKSLTQGLELPDAQLPAGYEGEFLLTVEGKGNYTGSIQKPIYVTDKAHLMKNATITIGKNIKNVEFTGKAVRLPVAEAASADAVTVKSGKIFLKPGRDYTVSYRNHDKVGKAELIVSGNGEYVGTKTAVFQIKGKAFSAKTVRVEGIASLEYTGKALTQNDVKLTWYAKDQSDEPLAYGKHYTISYAKNCNKGTATMTFKGIEKNGYSGSFKKTFKITAVDIADTTKVTRAHTMENMSFPYCKAGVKPVDEIRLTNGEGVLLRNGKDYTLKYTNNKAVADTSASKPPMVTVQGKGNYSGKFDVPFEITKSGLKAAFDEGGMQVKATAVAYQGKKADDYEYKPAIKVMEGKSALRAKADYEIQYLCNTQQAYREYLDAYESAAGNGKAVLSADKKLQEMMPRAVITAKADGNYRADGEIIVPLPIYQTKLTAKNLEITVTEMIYAGNQVTLEKQPTVTVKTVGGAMLTEGRDYTISYGANNKAGTNKGSVTVTGIAPRYGGSVTKKFNIVKKPIFY